MTTVESSAVWDAISSSAAAGALLVSVLVWETQRRRYRKQVDMQERLASIEEARRQDEIERRDEARHGALAADVRVSEFRMERPGGSRQSDKVSITIENRGPALARNIDIALLASEDGARSVNLGDAVERLDQFGDYSGKLRECYFQIPWELETARPLEVLGPNERATFPFWLGYRAFGNVSMRVAWEDGRGSRIARPAVYFDQDPAERY